MSTFVGWLVGQSVCKNAKKCKKWRIQLKSVNINCFNGGIDLITFLPAFFVCVSVCMFLLNLLQGLLLHSCKNEMYVSWLIYLGPHAVVIEYDPDSTIHRALHGRSHTCLFVR